MLPLLLPQLGSLLIVGLGFILPPEVIFTTTDESHPLASVTVTVYAPTHKPVIEEVVCPPGAQEYLYAPVPPVAVAVAEPLHLPTQVTLFCETDGLSCGGLPILVLSTVVQPLASFTLTVYPPGHRPVMV